MAVNKRLLQGAAAAGPLTPSENFKIVTYTGTGSSQSITGVGFKPDFVWIKQRTFVDNHYLLDSTRGPGYRIHSNLTAAQAGPDTNRFTSFDTDGFTVGSDNALNQIGENFVAWCWKANGGSTSSNTDGTITSTVQVNDTAGFSIVKYTGNNTANATIGHGLSSSPQLIISKNLDNGSAYWATYHHSIGITRKFYLNDNSTGDTVSGGWLDVSSTLITLKQTNANNINENGSDFINYCFTEVDGFSKFGSYTGNGSSNIIETGFEPAFIMFKRTDAANNWLILDNKRNTSNPRNCLLIPNSGSAEDCTDAAYNVNFLSNGFELLSNGTSINDSGGTYIYMAFAADPDTEAPTLADSFAVETYTGDGTSNRQINTLGFKPGLFWQKTRATSSSCTYNNLFDIVRGGNKTIYSNATDAEVTNQGCGYIQSFDDYGVTYTGDASGINNNGENFVIWAWKADDNEPTIEGGAAKAVYKFEDNANDVTGNYNGTASNVSYSSSGKFNKAADFSTGGANIAIGSPIPNTDTAVSVSAWIYLNTNATSYETVIGAGSATASSEAPFRVNVRYVSANTYKIEGLRQIAGTYYNTALSNYTDSSMPVETWHHVVWTYHPTGRTLTTYLNGSKVDTLSMGSTGSSVNDSTSVIGNFRNDTTADNFSGLIDQVRIYSGKLEDEQVSQLYAETSSDNDNVLLGGPPETIISANANSGFSIVKYEGDGTANRRIPHGLSAAPELIIAKPFITSAWVVYTAPTGTDKFFEFNDFSPVQTSSNYWGTSSPSATTFGVAPSNSNNNSTGNEIIAYCFHSVSGYSKIGSYTGNGSATGPTVTTGFQPDFVMIKRTDVNGYSWYIFDSARDPSNTRSKILKANDSGGEFTVSNSIDFNATSFQLKNTDVGWNASGSDYIYMAYKMNKTLYPTSGNMSFLVIAGGGGSSADSGGGPGGGAGGLRTSYGSTSGGGSSSESDITLAAGTYTITVGAGGAAYDGSNTSENGSNSSIAATGLTTITSLGGGAAGDFLKTPTSYKGNDGGAGGGSANSNGAFTRTGGAGTANQGFDGGDSFPYGSNDDRNAAGGGGGASQVGSDAASGVGGDGGNGLSVSITGSSIAYAGGGGGGCRGTSGTTAGTGGTGGGGDAVSSGVGNAGTANTGGGAGGGRSAGANGGSGVVILRLLTSEYSGTTTGSPTVTTDGDYTIIKYTGSGTYVHS